MEDIKSPLLANDVMEQEKKEQDDAATAAAVEIERRQRLANLSQSHHTSIELSHLPGTPLVPENQMQQHTMCNATFASISPKSIKSVATEGGSSVTSGLLCRICYSAEAANKDEVLVQPCNCSGTMLVHRSCLEKWLMQSNSDHCEICKFTFDLEKVPQSFKQWLSRGPTVSKDNKHLLNDIVCFLILTPMAIISIWYSVMFATSITQNQTQWEASGLLILTTFLLIVYCLWLMFSFRYHYRVFRDWQAKHPIITLNLSKSQISKGEPASPVSPNCPYTFSVIEFNETPSNVHQHSPLPENMPTPKLRFIADSRGQTKINEPVSPVSTIVV